METARDAVASYVTGAQRFFARSMRIFFGKPIRFLLPLLLIAGYGIYYAASQPDEYQSSGVLSVSSDTFLGSLTQVRDTQTNFQSVSTTIATQFNDLMQTDGFAQSVAEGAGLADPGGDALTDLDKIRSHVFAASVGDSLLRVTATSDDPEVARLLAKSGIASFKNFVISSEVAGSDVAEQFSDDLLTGYKKDVESASQALQDYLEKHPPPPNPNVDRDLPDQFEITRLNDALNRAQDRFDKAVDDRETARLATLQSSADIGQRLRVLDEPKASILPLAGLKSLATTVILFGILGLIVSAGAIALACVLDRSIHTATDLERIGASVRAVVPHAKGLKIEGSRNTSASQRQKVPARSAG